MSDFEQELLLVLQSMAGSLGRIAELLEKPPTSNGRRKGGKAGGK